MTMLTVASREKWASGGIFPSNPVPGKSGNGDRRWRSDAKGWTGANRLDRSRAREWHDLCCDTAVLKTRLLQETLRHWPMCLL
jgi:hypothetical protein